MSDKSKKVSNTTTYVWCNGVSRLANSCKDGFRCTKCGQVGHQVVKQQPGAKGSG